MASTTRWGILGTGNIAHSFAEALLETPDAVLQAVGSRNATNARAFADEYRCRTHYGSYLELVQDPTVDIVYVATPHAMHAENVLLCLEMGKAVLCEKPFTVNRREAEQVIALARQKKLFLMEAMWSRTLPAIREAKHMIEKGYIGKPRLLQADFSFVSDVNVEHRLRSPELGGGALLDVGIYPLSLASYLLGDIVEVKAMAELGSTGVDEQTAFTLRHHNGALSNCSCSIISESPLTLTVAGSEGHLRLTSPFFRAQSLVVCGNDGTTRTYRRPSIGNGYAHEAIEAGRCLQEGLTESPLMPLAETLAIIGHMDTIRAQCGVRYPADR